MAKCCMSNGYQLMYWCSYTLCLAVVLLMPFAQQRQTGERVSAAGCCIDVVAICVLLLSC